MSHPGNSTTVKNEKIRGPGAKRLYVDHHRAKVAQEKGLSRAEADAECRKEYDRILADPTTKPSLAHYETENQRILEFRKAQYA